MTKRPFLFLCASLMAIAALGAGLGNVRLAPARPVVFSVSGADGQPVGGASPFADLLFLALRVILALSIVSAAVMFIVSLVTRNGRRTLARLVVVLLVAVLLTKMLGTDASERTLRTGQVVRQTSAERREVPPPLTHVSPPGWIAPAVTFALAALGALLGLWLLRGRRSAPVVTDGRGELGTNAQDAVDALRNGHDVGETIQRCYLDMCELLERERGVARPAAMTPGEFDLALRSFDIPGDAVSTLTGLFEEIRYGGVEAAEEQKERAIGCLEAIAGSCRA